VGPLLHVEIKVSADTYPGFRPDFVSIQLYVLVLNALPQPFHKYVVPAAPFTILADWYPSLQKWAD